MAKKKIYTVTASGKFIVSLHAADFHEARRAFYGAFINGMENYLEENKLYVSNIRIPEEDGLDIVSVKKER